MRSQELPEQGRHKCRPFKFMEWRESFLVDEHGQFRWFQAMQIEDEGLIAAVELQSIVGEIVMGTLEFGVKVGAA